MKTNRMISRAITVLELIGSEPRGYTLHEICRDLDIPKTSAYDILVTLVEFGFLMKSHEDNKRFVIGLKAYEVGNKYMGKNSLQMNCKHYLIELSRNLGYTALLAVENQNNIVYMSKHEADDPIITTVILGSRNDMYSTALGKAILAGYTNENVAKRFKNTTMIKHNHNTIDSVDMLIQDLDRVRRRGYATSLGENIDERINSVACPIYGIDAELLGSICISGVIKKDDTIDKLGNQLIDVAKRLSRDLGYSHGFYLNLKP